MPPRFFVYVWNPPALMLAAAVLLVLAARAHTGRWTDLLLLFITGSYLVQTHVGPGPLVGAVGACGAPGSRTGTGVALRPCGRPTVSRARRTQSGVPQVPVDLDKPSHGC